MTNIIKMSLVAAVAVTGLSTTASADTLKEAFAATTVKGEIKSQYFQKETEAGVKSSILTNGGNVSIKTGSFNGITAGVTFQTAHVFSDKNVAAYNGDMDASGSVMSEAYLAYTMANTTAKIGRQYISTPLVAGSGSRIFKQSFEGFVLANTDIPDTTLVAAYVTKFQGRTDANGNAPTFEDFGEGAYTLFAKNNSVEDLTLRAQYAVAKIEGDDNTKIAFLDAEYKINPVTVSAQYFNSDEATNNDNGDLFGLKVAGKVGMVSLMAAYTTTSDDAPVNTGFGSGADLSYTAEAIAGGGESLTADTNSYKVAIGTKVKDLGLNLSYASYDDNSADDKVNATNLTATYSFTKELSTKVMHSIYGADSAQDYRSRVYLSYKF